MEALSGVLIAPRKSKQFTHSREILIPVIISHENGPYLAETDHFGTVYATARMAVKKLDNDDDVTRFIRFDMESLTGEDVTEEMADAYLDDFGGTPDNADVLPIYVAKSEAWKNWCDDFERPVNITRQYGTLNHAQQGI